MAERRVSDMLYQNAGDTNKNHRLNSFLTCDSCTELSNMFYDGVRLKWLDDLENVKRIVCQVWGLEGKWSSPGGQTKKCTSTNADLVLTWYKGKQNTLNFQGKDGDLVRDRCIYVCKQESHLKSKSQSLECDETKHSQSTISNASSDPNTVYKNVNTVTDTVGLVKSKLDKQNSIHHRLAPVLINNFSQTEQIAFSNNCGCSCRVLAAELEGVKLELVIMQTNFENKLDSVISRFHGPLKNRCTSERLP
jgi:hypothetical protein